MEIDPRASPLARREAFGVAALIVLVTAMTIGPTANNDVFLHLTTGRVILESGSIPREDDYSALARGRPFIAHEWLSAVIFHLVERFAGLDALIVLKALVAVCVASVLYAAARTLGAPPTMALPALTPVMILAAARIMERPHIFSYLLCALYLLLLARRRRGRTAPLWAFLPLQCLWANLHAGFVFGPLIVGLAAVGEVLDGWLHAALAGRAGKPDLRSVAHPRQAMNLAALATALVAVSVVNPYGIRLLHFPFELTSSGFMREIYEWQPPFDSSFQNTYMARYYLVWIVLGGAVLLAALGLAMRLGEAPAPGAFPALLFGAFLALSLRMNRSVTDFALVTFPGITAIASWIIPGSARVRWSGGLDALAGIVLLGLATWFALHGYPYGPRSHRDFGFGMSTSLPVAAADYLDANGIRGNAFNTYSAGAYLVYRFYPGVRVVMDSRNEVYGENLYAEYKQALTDQKALAAMLERIRADFIFLEWPAAGYTTALLVRRLGGWRLVYFDDLARIYLRENGHWNQLLARDGYSLLDPTLFRAGTLEPEAAPRALEEANRAIVQGRGSTIARLMRVDALYALGRKAEAVEEESRIVAGAPPLHEVYLSLGLLRLRAGDRREAARLLERALELRPHSSAALHLLAQAREQP